MQLLRNYKKKLANNKQFVGCFVDISILGIHDGHDASACLVKNGRVVRAVEEERLRNIKHWRGVPQRSIEFCLQEENPDMIAIAGIFRRFGRFSELQKYLRNHIDCPVVYWPHHLCHAASAFYTSGFKEALIVSLDAGGDGFSMMCYFGSQDQGLRILKQSSIYESLGALYSEVTASLGFRAMDEEGKTMALAAFGQPKDELIRFYDEIISWKSEYHSFVSSLSHNSNTLKNFLQQQIVNYSQENIAASIQRKLEKDVVNLLADLFSERECNNLCMTGGVFHNAQLALKIHQMFPKANKWIFPAMLDAGLSVGAALFEYFQESSSPVPSRIQNVYWGPLAPQPPDKLSPRLNITYLTESSLIKRIIELIYEESAVIGLCRRELEFGPRALGHRSLITRCDIPEMQNTLNQRKGRHNFQPFAPMVLHEAGERYLEDYFLSLFMTRAFQVTSEMQTIAPAVIHKDNTSRVQSVAIDTPDKFLRKLLESYYKETGTPFLLNTSFNLHGFPLVQNWADLWNALKKKLCDALIVGEILIENSD
ncbi:MAG: carbamoyltransferase N-terminal domain-containing protein [Promethearchaeota archaeon]